MTTAEHLTRIVAKCETLIPNHYSESRAVAGWKATIATIKSLLSRGKEGELELEDELLVDWIIAAWPEELL